MAGGTPVDGPVALRAAILERPDQFAQTFTEKLMTFGLGRSIEYQDMPMIRNIVRKAAADDYRLSSIVLNIVNSEQFRMRKTEEVEILTASIAAGQ